MIDLKYIEQMQLTKEFQDDMSAYNKEFPETPQSEEGYSISVKLSIYEQTPVQKAVE